MEDKVILHSKKKTLLLILMAIVFVMAGTTFFTMESAEIEKFETFNNPMLVHTLGISAIVFFGAGGLFLLRTLFDRTPALIIDRKGIIDNSSGGPTEIIPWSEIIEFRESKVSNQKFVSVMLKNPERFSFRGNVLQRKIQQINASVCGTPFNISATALTVKHAELLTTLQTCLEHYLNGAFGHPRHDPDV